MFYMFYLFCMDKIFLFIVHVEHVERAEILAYKFVWKQPEQLVYAVGVELSTNHCRLTLTTNEGE